MRYLICMMLMMMPLGCKSDCEKAAEALCQEVPKDTRLTNLLAARRKVGLPDMPSALEEELVSLENGLDSQTMESCIATAYYICASKAIR